MFSRVLGGLYLSKADEGSGADEAFTVAFRCGGKEDDGTVVEAHSPSQYISGGRKIPVNNCWSCITSAKLGIKQIVKVKNWRVT